MTSRNGCTSDKLTSPSLHNAPAADFEALAVTDCLSGVGGLEIVDYFSQLYGTGIDVLSMPNVYDLQFPEGGLFL